MNKCTDCEYKGYYGCAKLGGCKMETISKEMASKIKGYVEDNDCLGVFNFLDSVVEKESKEMALLPVQLCDGEPYAMGLLLSAINGLIERVNELTKEEDKSTVR